MNIYTRLFCEGCLPRLPHRTKYLNRLMQEAEGAIVGIWDTDVLLPKEQILEAVDAIRKGNAVMSFPYDGRFYMLPQEDSLLLKKREMNMEECCQKIYEYGLSCNSWGINIC